MNWTQISDEVLAMSGTDEFRAFMLGAALAAGVRIVRRAFRFFKGVMADE